MKRPWNMRGPNNARGKTQGNATTVNDSSKASISKEEPLIVMDAGDLSKEGCCSCGEGKTSEQTISARTQEGG